MQFRVNVMSVFTPMHSTLLTGEFATKIYLQTELTPCTKTSWWCEYYAISVKECSKFFQFEVAKDISVLPADCETKYCKTVCTYVLPETKTHFRSLFAQVIKNLILIIIWEILIRYTTRVVLYTIENICIEMNNKCTVSVYKCALQYGAGLPRPLYVLTIKEAIFCAPKYKNFIPLRAYLLRLSKHIKQKKYISENVKINRKKTKEKCLAFLSHIRHSKNGYRAN